MPKSFLTRVGDAFRVLAGSEAVQKSSISPDMAAWVRAEDVDAGGQGANLVSPYSQSAWVYVAVSILAQHLANIPFRISRVAGGKARKVRSLRGSHRPEHRRFVSRAVNQDILDSGPVVDLFNQPHPTMNGQLFWEMMVTWDALRGEFFVLPLDEADGPVDLSGRAPRVKRMVTLPTELFWHVVTGYDLVAWRYTGSPLLTPIPSEMLDPGEVIHSRTPNPYLYWRGMSPLIVALLAAQADYAGEQYQKGLWVNNADTGVIVTTDQQTTEEQRKLILAALRERKRKAGTADRPLFLWGGATVDKPTLTLMDMQFLETRKFLRSEIFSIFKVPEPLAGFTQDLNDGGAGGSINATMVGFLQNTIGSLCARIETAMDKIVKTFGEDLVGWFDVESLPVMQEARRSRIDTAAKAFQIGAPFNAINRLYDLGYDDLPWGDKSFLPFNLQEVTKDGVGKEEMPGEDELPGAPKPGEGGTPKPGEKPKDDGNPQDNGEPAADKGNPFNRLSKLLAAAIVPASSSVDVVGLWKRHVAARKSSVKLFRGKVGKVLDKFRGKTLSKLAEVHLEKNFDPKTKALIDIIFSAAEFGQSLNAELRTPIRALLQSAGDELNDEIGYDDPWQYPPKGMQEYLASREQPIMGVGGTVRDQLNTSLMEGIENGETHAQLTDRIKAVYNNLNTGEAKRVAMTEVNTAYNDARHQAMSDAGIEYKSWLSSHGPNVRPAHAAAEADYIDNPIPIGEPFIIMGEELMYPGDSSLGASPANIINCQCVQLAAVKQDEDEKSITYEIPGAGRITFKKNEND